MMSNAVVSTSKVKSYGRDRTRTLPGITSMVGGAQPIACHVTGVSAVQHKRPTASVCRVHIHDQSIVRIPWSKTWLA
jgi:hypothetical protein